MLSVNKYPKVYVEKRRKEIAAQVAAYKKVASAAKKLEPIFCNNMVLVLEISFVHRGRGQEGKDGNPLNEVRMLANSMLEHDGVMTAEKSIKYVPESSVLGYAFGDQIRLTAADFSRLSDAFFAEIKRKFM